jgi:hypothetical protein
MSCDEALGHRHSKWRREIFIADSEVSRSRIEYARRVGGVGQLNDRVVYADARGFARRGDLRNAFEEGSGAAASSGAPTRCAQLPNERQLSLHFRILRKSHRHRHVHRAAASLESVRTRRRCLRHPGRETQ